GRIRDALVAGVIGGAADQSLLGLERRDALRVQPVDQALYLGHHFGTDAVAGEKQQFMGRHIRSSFSPSCRARGVLKRREGIGKAPATGEKYRHQARAQKSTKTDLMTAAILFAFASATFLGAGVVTA